MLSGMHARSLLDWILWRRENLRAVKEGRVACADGNQYFNRPGPRLVDALEFLAGLLNDRHDIIPNSFAWRWLKDM